MGTELGTGRHWDANGHRRTWNGAGYRQKWSLVLADMGMEVIEMGNELN